jgi:ABC-2 type transport system permease protein
MSESLSRNSADAGAKTVAEERPRARWSESSLVQLTLVRFREFWREPEAVFWVFVFPLLLTAGLGIAFRNRPPEVLQVAVTDAALAEALRPAEGLRVRVLSPAEGAEALRLGRISLLAMREPDGQGVTFRLDDTNPEARSARVLAHQALQRAAGVQDAVPTGVEVVREPGSRYIDFLIPGLLGMNLMGSGIWGLGFTIVDARRKKLLKRLVASPMSRAEYLLSFLLSRLVMLVIEIQVLVGFGVVVFGVPVRGALWELLTLVLLASFMFSALGLLIASRVRTIEAASGLMNFIMLPMWLFSGVFFSAERFPDVLQPAIRLLPLTAVVDGLRSNMLQGTSLTALMPQVGIMVGWLMVCFVLAMKLFRWR